MKNVKWFLPVLALAFASCTSTQVVSSYKDENAPVRDYKKILVLGIFQQKDRAVRQEVEANLAARLRASGYNAVTAMDEYGPKAFEKVAEEDIIGQVKTAGYDAVITTALLDKSNDRTYQQGTSRIQPVGVYYNRFGRYYSTIYDRVYEPGYYTTSTNYFLETNLYDVANGDLVLEKQKESTIFITEGDSASGSITKARNVETQAVFSLRGKPLNCFGLTKKIVYENEEFNLLQHALNIEEGYEGLRYNNIVIATDADVDGMHIRLLLMTFFLQFFPDLVKNGHVYILETPLFRVRDKKETIYCYDIPAKQAAVQKLGGKPEITRFKGLGEISPHEFAAFISADIKLQPLIPEQGEHMQELLEYYMGKNSQSRQDFIIDNLRIESNEAVAEA